MRSTIEARLRKLERHVEAREGGKPWAWVITRQDDELPGKLAEMEAAGTYQPGWNFVHWRVVAPAHSPERTAH